MLSSLRVLVLKLERAKIQSEQRFNGLRGFEIDFDVGFFTVAIDRQT